LRAAEGLASHLPGIDHARMPQLLWSLFLCWNLATILTFGWDKWQSRRPNARRIRERTLLWMIGLGGWIGAWLAMGWFRHKTIKQPFRRWAVLWTVLNPTWLLLAWTWQVLGSA
jgi:uncharacterized membrane protein YsdA (DUF1294 family)